ncbi:LacI family transcriptional regulator [Natranaerovirga hydrolytica]|uniref:LacI family transcriptional regulator n=1 Tax=Natranaerovirga hydrolytica TaxID=680378 RepID=A0A4R1MLI0_9FIRM|nr:LacI family DNA-binding transcriptional regulator [Natranaerovirga hydrolytica]TCK92712.1 LacI family transcriptional regulator [Natranaerovirga hydrolytica]
MTIYDIAKVAGVSASTVSRVINNKENIKKETRDKVKQILREYNYIPNDQARGLVTRSTKLIGILVVDIRNAHHTDIAFVVEKFLRKKGYCSIILNAGEDESEMCEAIRIIEQRRVDGVLLIGSMFQNKRVKTEIIQNLSHIPIVMANGYIDRSNVYGVLVDEYEGVKKCVDLLFSKGKNNIAFIAKSTTPSSQEKIKGYIEGLKKHNYLEKDIIIIETNNTLKGGYKATQELLMEKKHIDAIIYSEDIIAVGGIQAVKDLGLCIPKKVAIIGVDNTIYGQIISPSLTSLDNKMTDMALQASNILIDDLEGMNHPEKIMLFSEIVERETT